MSIPSAGRELHRGFCPDCGATVFARNTAAKGIVFLIPAALDDPSVLMPRLEIWTGRTKRPDSLDPALPAFEGQPSDAEMLSPHRSKFLSMQNPAILAKHQFKVSVLWERSMRHASVEPDQVDFLCQIF